MRFSKALNHFGSIKAVAEAVQLNPSTVQAWKKSGLIPDKWRPTLNDAMRQPSNRQKQPSASRLIPSFLLMAP